MKRFKNKCLGGVAVMSLLACTNFVQAGTVSAPQVTLHHQQVGSNKVNVDLGVEGLGDEVVALEVSIIADDVQSVLAAASKVENSYMTYQLTKLSNGQEKISCYIVSEDKEVPLKAAESNGLLTSFSLQTAGKLMIDKAHVYIKVIEKGYNTQTYENQEMIYTEAEYKPGTTEDNNSGSNNGTNSDSSSDDDTTAGGGSSNSGNSSTNGGSASQSNTNNNNTNAENNNSNVSFTDLEKHWAKSAILNMANKGVIKGYADGSFKPSASITRGEFATLLARAFEIEKVSSYNPFKDVMADKWYTDGIVALYHAGITSGRADGTFGINAPITNEEISAMLYRTITVCNMNMAEINPLGINFKDVDKISSYAKEAVSSLVKMGIISGQPDGSFGPKSSTSRAQVAVMLDRVFTLEKK